MAWISVAARARLWRICCGRLDFEVSLYDSFFVPDQGPLDADYDFICATEVVEHLHRPAQELERLWSLLRPGGWMGVMTKLVLDRTAFAAGTIKMIRRMCAFFSVDAWRWWAQNHGASLEIIGADVILLQQTRPNFPLLAS